jgi:UDP-N-acetylglucosamine--N-acetylmuramyl-(pentapeptide) pyrophosphoryl-undecaprenol N-acetylglucosamine transferase
VGRAGGTTLSEIAVVGVPSLLVPFPHHADRHQERNAGVLARAGAAVIIEESELGPEKLRAALEDVLFSQEKLDAMSRRARALARPGAADAVIDLALRLGAAGGRSR